jgi:hypothetical protein
VLGSATDGSKVMTWTTASVVRSTHTSFGPPGFVGWNSGLPVSSTHSRSAGSTTTLCTDTNAPASSSPDGEFHASSGYGTATPSRSSVTVAGTSSPQSG